MLGCLGPRDEKKTDQQQYQGTLRADRILVLISICLLLAGHGRRT